MKRIAGEHNRFEMRNHQAYEQKVHFTVHVRRNRLIPRSLRGVSQARRASTMFDKN